MAEAILGISAFYHDSATALIIDGEIDEARMELKDITAIALDDKPCMRFEQLEWAFSSFRNKRPGSPVLRKTRENRLPIFQI